MPVCMVDGVAADTLVSLADGRRVPIHLLVGTSPSVAVMSGAGRLDWSRAASIAPVGWQPIFNVRLASGRDFKASATTALLTGTGAKPVGEIQAGDRVAIARRLAEPTDPQLWPDLRVALLGQLIGDGSYLVNAPMRYTTSSEENSGVVAEAAKSEFGAKVTRYAGRRTWHQLMISGNGNRWHPAGINAWFRELGIFGQYSHEKRVPAFAFQLATEQVALLLRHLWATDGCLWISQKPSPHAVAVHYSTNSPGLAGDVAALLLRTGIVARIAQAAKAGHRTGYLVHVSGAEDQLRFLDTVGAFGPKKAPAERLREVLLTKRPNTNVDTVPIEVFQHLRQRMTELGITQRQMAAMRGTAYGGDAHFGFSPSRATVLDYAERLDDESLRTQATNDMFWDRVTGVAPYGQENVFRVQIHRSESWLADGIVSGG